MEKIKSFFKVIDKIIIFILQLITIAIFISIMLIMTANVILRFKPLFSLHWLDEIIELLFAALVFYGSAALWFTKGHFSAGDWLSRMIKNQRLKNLYNVLLEIIVLVFLLIFLYYSYNLYSRAFDVTNALAIPKKVLYSCMPISGLVMIYFILKNIITGIASVIKPKDEAETGQQSET